MENITDLFAEVSNGLNQETSGKGSTKKKAKASSLQSSAMTEAMSLLSNPKKLKGILMLVGVLLIIGLISTIAFFVIYPICIAWAVGSYIIVFIIGKVIKLFNNLKAKKNVNSKWDR